MESAPTAGRVRGGCRGGSITFLKRFSLPDRVRNETCDNNKKRPRRCFQRKGRGAYLLIQQIATRIHAIPIVSFLMASLNDILLTIIS